MNDPQITCLRYLLKTGLSLEFENPPLLEVESDEFRLKLENGELSAWPKIHYSSESAARGALELYLKAWEINEALRLGQREMCFQYQSATVEDRQPSAGEHSEATYVTSSFDLLRSVVQRKQLDSYPAPPENFTVSPDVETMWLRYEQYLQGREPILSMANFCLTVLEQSAKSEALKGNPRQKAAQLYNIEFDVLHKLGGLSANRGDEMTARKVSGQSDNQPLSDSEESWIRQCMLILIRRVGEYAKDPQKQLTQITTSDI